MYPNTVHKRKPNVTAFERIVRLASYSEKPSSLVIERLLAEGYSDAEAQYAVDKAIEYGVINDERYADAYIRSQLAKGEGIDGIKRKLSQGGIDVDALTNLSTDLNDVSREEEVDRALDLLSRKPPYGSNLRDKAYKTLMRKGYSSSVSSTAARLWCDRITT